MNSLNTISQNKNSRRKFIGKIAATASLSGLAGPLLASSVFNSNTIPDTKMAGEADAWFKKIKGAHRVVYDATQPHDVLPFAWPRVFLVTNEATGSPADDCGVVVVLRHDAIPYAMESSLWAKYNLGEVFHAPDPQTGKPATRNPFWKPKAGDFQFPGIGEVAIGINQLQESGVMFCVCNAALTVYSAAIAESMNKEGGDIYNEWKAGLLPDIQVVPSGVWALGRAQEHGCAYIFAG